MATSGSATPPGEGCSVLSLLVRGPNIRDIQQVRVEIGIMEIGAELVILLE